jgi:hypothetical protein
MGVHKFFTTRQPASAAAMGLDVEGEVKMLVEEIKRLGSKGADGKTAVRQQ